MTTKYNLQEIQSLIDSGYTYRMLTDKLGISSAVITKYNNLNLIKTKNRSEASKLAAIKHPHTHTKESKLKISIARKKYLFNNPDKVPYLLNHSHKESYPEKYFTELFKKENFKIEKEYSVKPYNLDFAIPNKQIDIEIDGDQHYLDKKMIAHDKRRNNYLNNLGWKVIRIKWSDYQKLSFELKQEFIKQLINDCNSVQEKTDNISAIG